MLLQVHDELIFEGPSAEMDALRGDGPAHHARLAGLGRAPEGRASKSARPGAKSNRPVRKWGAQGASPL
jgi:hypothetical protein